MLGKAQHVKAKRYQGDAAGNPDKVPLAFPEQHQQQGPDDVELPLDRQAPQMQKRL